MFNEWLVTLNHEEIKQVRELIPSTDVENLTKLVEFIQARMTEAYMGERANILYVGGITRKEYKASNGHLMIGEFDKSGDQVNIATAFHSSNCQCETGEWNYD